MKHKIKICSFNCHSFNANIEVINELLDINDILLIQETFLTDDSMIQFLIGPNYSFCSTLAEQKYFSGRPTGGLLMIWHTSIDQYVKCLKHNNRIMGLKLESPFEEYLLVNIYAPYEQGTIDSYNKYIEFLCSLKDFIEEYSDHSVLIIGDYYADPAGGRFWDQIRDFVIELSFNIADLGLSPNSFTF